jgi:hypothetical protein
MMLRALKSAATQSEMNYFAASCEVSLRASSYRTIHPRSKLTGYSGSIIRKPVAKKLVTSKETSSKKSVKKLTKS